MDRPETRYAVTDDDAPDIHPVGFDEAVTRTRSEGAIG